MTEILITEANDSHKIKRYYYLWLNFFLHSAEKQMIHKASTSTPTSLWLKAPIFHRKANESHNINRYKVVYIAFAVAMFLHSMQPNKHAVTHHQCIQCAPWNFVPLWLLYISLTEASNSHTFKRHCRLLNLCCHSLFMFHSKAQHLHMNSIAGSMLLQCISEINRKIIYSCNNDTGFELADCVLWVRDERPYGLYI